MSKTEIAWATDTWNPIIGCTKISPGCKNCYAEKMACRLGAMGQLSYRAVIHPAMDLPDAQGWANGYWNNHTHLVESALTDPLPWRKPRRIFVCSMSDLFHENNPFEWIDRVFAVMALCPQHTFLCLTKRAKRMREYFSDEAAIVSRISRSIMADRGPIEMFNAWPLPNVWLGVTVEDQQRADERIPELLSTPAAVRFLSVEPMLGAVDVRDALKPICTRAVCKWHGYSGLPDGHGRGVPRINWVIVGGESGPKARPCNVEWIRGIVQQCQAASVPVFVKQLGAKACNGFHDYTPNADVYGPPSFKPRLLDLKHPKGGDMSEWPEDLRVQEFPAARNARG